jgi:hypothetical protein
MNHVGFIAGLATGLWYVVSPPMKDNPFENSVSLTIYQGSAGA